ncbi:WXG100 family type VII secretion target, partial [Listeria sp. FSL L7-1485]
GEDPITGDKLSWGERGLSLLFIIPLAKIGKYGAKGFKFVYEGIEDANKIHKKADKVKDAEKSTKKASGANQKVISELESPVLDGRRVESGAKVDDVKPIWGTDSKGRPIIEKEFPQVAKEHGFSDIIDNYSTAANEFPLVGGDGLDRKFFQIEGSNNGRKGVFEWIVEPNGDVSHRRFIDGGVLTGKPNQIPKK